MINYQLIGIGFVLTIGNIYGKSLRLKIYNGIHFTTQSDILYKYHELKNLEILFELIANQFTHPGYKTMTNIFR